MASIGHIAVGMAAARAYHHGQQPHPWKVAASMVLWSGLSLLPDLDVLGFGFGIQYADPWGHRGATHSLLFTVGLGLVLGMLAPSGGRTRLRTAAFAAAVLVSHPLLDTLTDGGLGCALLWPFESTRYFAPWNPIPVAPIGARFFTMAGVRVAVPELLLFSPFIAYALWRRGDPSRPSQHSDP